MDEVRKLLDWNDLGPHRFLEEVPSAVFLVNPAGRIVWANRTTVTLFGYARPEIVGHPIDIQLSPIETDKGIMACAWVRERGSK